MEQDDNLLNRRASGVLLHLTSLPSREGIGTIGHPAYQFVDFLQESGQSAWQTLPIGPTPLNGNPYVSYCSFAGNPLFICTDLLRESGLLLDENPCPEPDETSESVDFEKVTQWKIPLLRCAALRLQKLIKRGYHATLFETFCEENDYWLNDYALFSAILSSQNVGKWTDFPEAVRNRHPEEITALSKDLAHDIDIIKCIQYIFFHQWIALRRYAADRKISIIGDIPMYMGPNSVEIWEKPEFFMVDPTTGIRTMVAGVPPDYFSEEGQSWGFPLYRWDILKQDGFEWWVRRIHYALGLFDVIRLDHFRGFSAYWAIPASAKSAREGQWQPCPGHELFEELHRHFGHLPIIVEDLGYIDEDVTKLRDTFGFPGMKILQFAFDGDPNNCHLPYNFKDNNCVVYTGTHDNNTLCGWFNGDCPPEAQNRVSSFVGNGSSMGISWDFIRIALSSVARLSIIPLQDILGLGAASRMNRPGTATGNWSWRCHRDAITSQHAKELRSLTAIFGRLPS